MFSLVLGAKTTNGQGLRESAVALLDQVEPGSGQACQLHLQIQVIVATINAAQAAPFMDDELTRLEAILPQLTLECDVQQAAQQTALLQRLEALQQSVARCTELGEARAFCRYRAECREVSQLTLRLKGFWRTATSSCHEP